MNRLTGGAVPHAARRQDDRRPVHRQRTLLRRQAALLLRYG